MPVRLLDTSPRWLRLTLGCSSGVLVVTGVGFFFGQLTQFDITPFTLLLHLTLALAVSSWILNLRIRISPDRKPLVAIGVAVDWLLSDGRGQRHHAGSWGYADGYCWRLRDLYSIPS